MSVENRQAIDERAELIESRARALVEVEVEIAARSPWTRRLGQVPADPVERENWMVAAAAVATYRDRYKVTSDLPLGGGEYNDAQRSDRQRAQSALRHAVELSRTSEPVHGGSWTGLRALSGP